MNSNRFINKKVQSIQLSPIRKFFNLVSEVPGAISLTIGQPDFNTPESIKSAGINAIRNNYTKYTHNQGREDLRQELGKYLKSHYNICYDYEKEITVTVGSGEAIDAVIRTIVDDNDEVLIPSPGYVAYGACVTLAGGIPVYVPLYFDDSFKLKADILEKYITRKTKALILSYPSNPTGATMDMDDLSGIADIAKKYDLFVISDEIYSELTYGKKHVSIASINGMKERSAVINGFSKAYSMTGWRLGYVAAPSRIMEQIVKVHQYDVTCAPSISQAAGIEALKNGDKYISLMVSEYDRRRQYCYNRLRAMGLLCFNPDGAFYIFPEIKKYNMPSEEFCRRLLYENKLAVVPGSAFGIYGEGYIRISYAYSMDVLEEGLDRLEEFIEKLE
ncbi:MAG: aminotransferase class I/II-fold pyridoxal phosphate-dependent enzyme [Clostridiales bacterium]|nr:aminotransferase class I/II-fold pyridoxal phosphate-dependent enzyme [Clostridiales bacterium]